MQTPPARRWAIEHLALPTERGEMRRAEEEGRASRAESPGAPPLVESRTELRRGEAEAEAEEVEAVVGEEQVLPPALPPRTSECTKTKILERTVQTRGNNSAAQRFLHC